MPPGDAPDIDCAARLRAVAVGARLDVLRRLATGPLCVGELRERLGISQSLLSHHLQVLRREKLVYTRRLGRAVEYRLAAGVHTGDGKAIDLGCCKLDFEDQPAQ